jgi:hypothetical protein
VEGYCECESDDVLLDSIKSWNWLLAERCEVGAVGVSSFHLNLFEFIKS